MIFALFSNKISRNNQKLNVNKMDYDETNLKMIFYEK